MKRKSFSGPMTTWTDKELEDRFGHKVTKGQKEDLKMWEDEEHERQEGRKKPVRTRWM